MRKTSWIALAALFVVSIGAPAAVRGQQSAKQSASAQTPQTSQASVASQSKASSAQQDPLAAAARKAREQRKNAPKAAKVFTNDNLPTSGGLSTVGEAAPASAKSNTSKASATAAAAAPAANDEATWRAKFATLRDQLQRDQDELSVMQRELGEQQMQYYNGNPQKAAQDQASGEPLGAAYNKKREEIDAKKKQVEADQEAISGAQDALHQAGGDPGWAR
ncbi:MAG: hypothetical protein ACRD4R_09890 [Candidatus Acidiferrales bacterium]